MKAAGEQEIFEGFELSEIMAISSRSYFWLWHLESLGCRH